MEKTLCVIKPNSVSEGNIGEIIRIFEINYFEILAMKMTKLTKSQAEKFYEIHKERPFYDDLCTFMSSGPVVAFVVCDDDAVERVRKIIGHTNPEEAADNTIRKLYGDNIDENAIHASDSVKTAQSEIEFFFPNFEQESFETDYID